MKAVLAATFYDDARKQEEVRNLRNWRFGYTRPLEAHLRYSLESPERALGAARAGLEEFYRTFEFHREGKKYTLAEAFGPGFPTSKIHTGVVKGSGTARKFHVPYKGRDLEGQALREQAARWATNGTIERDTQTALSWVSAGRDWSTALKDRYFVLLGAGAAMGPLRVLLSLGANIIALDLKRKDIWDRLLAWTKESAGTLIFPLDRPQESVANDSELAAAAGADLLNDGPSVAAWLKELYPGAPFTLGNYVYLDAVLFVRVTLACDAIIKSVLEHRGPSASIAFLCTPTDYHVIPKEAHLAARANSKSLRSWLYLLCRLSPIPKLKLVSNVRPPVRTSDGSELYYVDGIVPEQGPNYALSKRMQHWRCLVARAAGHTVSSNIAPSTATISVVKNKTFAWAYDGLPVVCPQIEIFQEQTSNAVMTGLLLHDLYKPESVANPQVPLKNPYELMAATSFHGGVWRMGFTMASTGVVSVLMHFAKVYRYLLLVLFLALLYFVFLA